MITGIIFDCFGVLTTDKWKEFVATLAFEKRQPASDLNHALDRGLISRQEFLEQISALTGHTPEMVESVIDSDMDKNVPLLKLIEDLHEKYKIGILSNVSSNWVRDKFLSEQEKKLFDDILLSYDVGMIKPEQAIYELSAQRLGCNVEDCLFIDDSPGHCEGAEQVGMKTILYKDFIQCKTNINKILQS